MTELINASKRQLIPRWHTSRKMEFVRALKTVDTSQEQDINEEYFNIVEKKQTWEKSSSLASATDLFVSLNLANMTLDPQFEKTKNYLLSKKDELSSTVNNIVSPQLRRLDPSNNYTTNKDRIYVILGILKGFIKDCPHDALTWNDLAFYYTVLGEREKAEHCMRVAFGLQSKHPFLARSYARLLVHYDEPDKAIHILNKTGLVKDHPEILSADISIRKAFDVKGADVKAARRLIDKYSSNRPSIISELSASIGTFELESGSSKRAKGHLATSALVPTENTIAQLKWIAQQHDVFIPVAQNSIKSLEADAISDYNTKEYSRCVDKLMMLHRFQPFSEGALVDAGYLSLVALDDPEFICNSSEYFGADVLEGFTAKNNYIVARLLVGDSENIGKMLLDLEGLAREERQKAVLSATVGMYLYSVGEIESGRKNYENTNVFFKADKDHFSLALSLIHQGMMEKRSDQDFAIKIFERAKIEAKKASKSPEVLEKVERELGSLDKGRR